MISTLNRLPNGNIELIITIPWKRINIAYEKALNNLVKNAEIKGFRRGKAPKKLVEEKADKGKLYGEALQILIPEVYLQAVREYQLKPIVSPRIKIISANEEKEWQIQVITCELPIVKLNNYKEEIKKALSAEKIWIPGKEEQNDKKEKKEEKLEKIFSVLLKTAKVQLPQLLIEEELNKMLSRLIDQINSVGLTIEQYLSSIGKSLEKLKEEYLKQAEETLKLELILSFIADEQKIQISEKEIENLINAIPDEKTRNDFNSYEQKLYLKQLLRKQKVIDNLISL